MLPYFIFCHSWFVNMEGGWSGSSCPDRNANYQIYFQHLLSEISHNQSLLLLDIEFCVKTAFKCKKLLMNPRDSSSWSPLLLALMGLSRDNMKRLSKPKESFALSLTSDFASNLVKVVDLANHGLIWTSSAGLFLFFDALHIEDLNWWAKTLWMPISSVLFWVDHVCSLNFKQNVNLSHFDEIKLFSWIVSHCWTFEPPSLYPLKWRIHFLKRSI